MAQTRPILPSAAVLALLVAAWWTVVAATQSVIFPTPWQVVRGTVELIRDGTLWEHIGASLFRVGAGFFLAVVFAIPLGLWMGWARGAFTTLNPIIQILRPISPIAWIPIAILWFGVGNASPIYLIFISSVFPMVVQTAAGVHTIERRYLRAAQNFGGSRYTLFRRVVIPAVLPQIIVGMRIGLGVACTSSLKTARIDLTREWAYAQCESVRTRSQPFRQQPCGTASPSTAAQRARAVAITEALFSGLSSALP